MVNIYIFEIDIKINTGKNRNFSMWKKKYYIVEIFVVVYI